MTYENNRTLLYDHVFRAYVIKSTLITHFEKFRSKKNIGYKFWLKLS